MTLPVPVPAERLLGASLLRMRRRSPFFATLALFARFVPTDEVPTAATDGRDVFYNPAFVGSLPPAEQDGLLLHELLHAALLHVPRRGARDPKLWNVAADYAVNGMIARVPGFELPAGGLQDEALEDRNVEEVYAILSRGPKPPPEPAELDLLDGPPGGGDGTGEEGEGQAKAGGPLDRAGRAALEAHWRHALQQAGAVARSAERGRLPAGLAREVGRLSLARLDWRSHLWRYLVQTPTDFAAFDRRFVSRGLYLETLEGESARVFVAVDTSGSVDDDQTRAFLGEVQGILRAYPGVECQLYYADAAVYGPYRLTADGEIPTPQGGGGTDFRPFFEAVAAGAEPFSGGVCVYLTDGYGDFPAEPPELPTLWVVTPGGLNPEGFPFGEVVGMLDEP